MRERTGLGVGSGATSCLGCLECKAGASLNEKGIVKKDNCNRLGRTLNSLEILVFNESVSKKTIRHSTARQFDMNFFDLDNATSTVQ